MNSKPLIMGARILGLLCVLLGGISEGAEVSLAWDPSPSTVDGYRIYYKTGAAGPPYTSSTSLGNVTTTTVTGLTEGVTYFFAVTAYAGTAESTFSNEVTYTIPSATDTTAPAVTISTPTSGTTYSTAATPITLAGTASDAVGVTQVSWSSNRGGSGTCTGTSSWSCAGIVLQSGSNILTVTGRDAANNAGTDTLTVTYYLPPSANFSADVVSGEPPLTVQFTDLSTGTITSRLWSFGDGQTSTATNPSHVYADSGTYTVILTVSGPGGERSKTVTDYVQVFPLPPERLRFSSGS